MDSEQILNLIAQQPPPGASQRPGYFDLPPGMVREETEHGNVVTVRDPGTGWTREWHVCRDWELLAEHQLRCGHVNGNGDRCGYVVFTGYLPEGSVPYQEAVCEYHAIPEADREHRPESG